MTAKSPTADSDVPEGFVPLFRTSPFQDTLGPLFYRRTKASFVVGLRIASKHANARGNAHGGLLLTLADIALGYTAEASSDPPLALTTVNITGDFTGPAQVGDWLLAEVDIQKIGRRLVFANAYLVVGEERIARVSAIFARAPASQGRPDAG